MFDVNADKAATAAVDEAAKVIVPQLGGQLAQAAKAAVDEAAAKLTPEIDAGLGRLEAAAKALPGQVAAAVAPILAETAVALGNELKELLIGRTITITIG